MTLKSAKKWLIVIIILAVSIALFLYMKSSKPKIPTNPAKERVWLVETVELSSGRNAPTTKLYGTVESSKKVSISASSTAVLDKLHVSSGDYVSKGEPIFALNALDVSIPVEQAKADIADIQAQIELQKLNNTVNVKRLEQERKIYKLKQDAVARNEKLLSKSLASQSVLDAAKEALVRQEYSVIGAEQLVQQNEQQLVQLQARLVKSEQSLSKAELAMERASLTAPYDLRIASVKVSEGDLLTQNQPMLTYYSTDSLELKSKVSNIKFAQLLTHLKQNIDTVALIDWQKGLYELPLQRLDGEADVSGVNAYFKIPASINDIRVGSLLSVDLIEPSIGQSFLVPYSALYGNNRVYVVENGRLVRKSVVIRGQKSANGKLVAIVTGDLKAGDRVSITHLPNAIQDLKVVEAE